MGEQKTISDTFVRELTKAQFDLKLYIVSLLGNTRDAMDVLQNTNVDLWRKAATYDPSRPFLPWAKALAHFQVLTWRKCQSRDKLLFDDSVVDVLGGDLAASEPDSEREMAALDGCLGKMTDFQRGYLNARYTLRLGIPEMAKRFNQTPPAIVSLLYRLRNMLHDCVETTLQSGTVN